MRAIKRDKWYMELREKIWKDPIHKHKHSIKVA